MRGVLCGIAATTFAACGTGQEASSLVIPVLLYASDQCSAADSGVRWFASEQEWLAAYGVAAGSELAAAARPPSSVDFAAEGVVLIAMGTRPTGGFALQASTTPVELVNGVLRIAVEWHEPAADAFLPQVVTSPCLFLKLPNLRFERIEIVDADGRIRASGPR